MDSRPLISICIPCYNGAEFIARTLQSVLTQSLDNVEIIIGDNKSTDDSVAIVRGFSDRRIKLFQNEAIWAWEGTGTGFCLKPPADMSKFYAPMIFYIRTASRDRPRS